MSQGDLLACMYPGLADNLGQDRLCDLIASDRSLAYRRGISLRAIASRRLDTLCKIADGIDKQCTDASFVRTNPLSRAHLHPSSHFMLEALPFPGNAETHCAVKRYDFADLQCRLLEYDSSQSAPELDDDIPVGIAVWPNAVKWCGHLADGAHADIKPQDIVLELGAGVGIVGIVIAALVGCQVVLTDCDESCLQMSRVNVFLNDLTLKAARERSDPGHVGTAVAVQSLCWGEKVDAMYTVVVASDTCYSEKSVEQIFLTVASCLKADGKFLLGHTPREHIFEDQMLFDAAEKHGFKFVDITPWSSNNTEWAVYEFRRACDS